MKSIFRRTSIRQYQDREVEPDKVEMLLRAAMAAPSAGNQQPWEFYVVTDRRILGELAASSPYAGCAAGAPLAIVACYRENVRYPEYVQIDLSASTENLLLEAEELGLGAVWLGIAPIPERMKKVKESLGLKRGVQAFAVIPCGYPADHKPQQDRYDMERIHYMKGTPD